jgi:sporulation protein YlmC with PRC-barrel domain
MWLDAPDATLLNAHQKEEYLMADSINTTANRDLIASDKVEGTAVYNPGGERLGTISNIMVDKRSGQAEYAVMQFGGFLGIGADYYPVPWQMLRYDVEQSGYVVDLDKDRLNDAPRYGDEQPTYDAAYNQQVYSYYGVTY